MDFVSEGVFVLLVLIIVPRFDPFLLGEKIKTQIFSIPTRDRGEQLFWGSQKPFFRREDYSRLRIYTIDFNFSGVAKTLFSARRLLPFMYSTDFNSIAPFYQILRFFTSCPM